MRWHSGLFIHCEKDHQLFGCFYYGLYFHHYFHHLLHYRDFTTLLFSSTQEHKNGLKHNFNLKLQKKLPLVWVWLKSKKYLLWLIYIDCKSIQMVSIRRFTAWNTYRIFLDWRNEVLFFPLLPIWCEHSRVRAPAKHGSVYEAWAIVAEMLW